MELTKMHWIGIIAGLIVIGFSFLFTGSNFFMVIIGIGFIIVALPFVIEIIIEARRNSEKEEMFIEFARSLVESVKTGTPISKSIINMKNKPFGILSPNIQKLANQISMGIPLRIALQTFAKDVDNKTITRSLVLIGQAERAGGDIGEILESVAGAVSLSDRLNKERRAAISTLVVQGYIIFFIFIIIILIMQFKIIPLISGIADIGTINNAGVSSGLNLGGGTPIDAKTISGAFLYLILIQGFFSGLTIGKLSEGNIKSGIKHSFALMLMSFVIYAGANLIFG
ncbi:MAG: type II secretion system F family protein [Nanoarchaeota archaeon]|nr:type II secretion system F family protein [Nanoarchaeota archaeon]